jgi:hypothetical protein
MDNDGRTGGKAVRTGRTSFARSLKSYQQHLHTIIVRSRSRLIHIYPRVWFIIPSLRFHPLDDVQYHTVRTGIAQSIVHFDIN